MTNLDFSGLGDLATKSGNPGWQPLTASDLAYGSVVAFDQSLMASACVWLVNQPDGPQVIFAEMLKPEGDFGKGIEADLMRGVSIFSQARRYFAQYSELVEDYVHESPPNPSALQKGTGSSSLMAAQAVRCAAAVEGKTLTMLGAQPGKKLMCGNANAKKPVAHAAMQQHIFPWLIGSDLVTNEAHRDALVVALLHLYRKKANS